MPETEYETTEEAAPRKGGKKKIIIILFVIILLAGSAGGGFYYWRLRSAAAANAAAEGADLKHAGEKDESEKKAPKKPGDALSNALPDDEEVSQIIELPPFIVNLADTEQARYLRMTVSLGVGGEETEAEKPSQLFMTKIRNAMLAVLSDKQSDEILTVDGKSKLRAELLKAAQAAADEPEVKAIYITDFIVQL